MATENRDWFDDYRKNLASAGISTDDPDSVICPLCWQEKRYSDLTLEHLVPESIGGRQRILTCRGCNNDQGSNLDAHLTQYQRVVDAFNGSGTIPVEMNINGHRLVANLNWATKEFHVVGKATNPAASMASRQEFAAGKVSSVKFTMLFGCAKNNFQTAVLRSAYLILFKCVGYEYARHDVVQRIRRRIADPSLDHPCLASLIFEARNFKVPFDSQHYVVRSDVDGVRVFTVIVRVRKATTTYLGALLPNPFDRGDEFFDLMESRSKQLHGRRLEFPIAAFLES
jgi:5-methylcytosine-specific restriction endonuclease McrA